MKRCLSDTMYTSYDLHRFDLMCNYNFSYEYYLRDGGGQPFEGLAPHSWFSA